MPLFSIIIPVYNLIECLPRCVSSIREQSFADWEMLLIDDGSTDGSEELCDQFAASDPRIRVFHKPNGGVSSARNLGLDHAVGDYIWFVDGDDAIKQGALEILMKRILKHPNTNMILFGAETVNIGSPQRHSNAIVGSDIGIYDCTVPRQFQDLYSSYIVSAWNACYQRKAINTTRFRPIAIGEDVLFSMELLFSLNNAIVTQDVLYTYYLRQGSAIHKRSLKHFQDFLEYCKRVCNLKSKRQKWIHATMEKRYWNKLCGEALMHAESLPKEYRSEARSIWYATIREILDFNFFTGTRAFFLKTIHVSRFFPLGYYFLLFGFHFKRMITNFRHKRATQ
jgi:glycosyltransferase involved in cell wall biosynthesis